MRNNQSKPALRQFVNLGGDGDCGFLSIAGSFVDQSLNGELDKQFAAGEYDQLLKEYFKDYPSHIHIHLNRQPAIEKIRYLYNTVYKQDLAAFAKALGYTLRQMAVTEIYNHPDEYPGCFVDQHEGTALANMRKPHTWIDESTLLACSRVIKLPVIVEPSRMGYSGNNQTLTYNGNADGPAITVQLHHQHYVPSLSNTAAESLKQTRQSANLATTSSSALQSPTPRGYADLDAAEIQRLLREDKANQTKLHTIRQQLSAKDGGQLLALFIKYQDSNDYLSGYAAKYADEGFRQLLAVAKTGANVDGFLEDNTKALLVEKISLAILHNYVPMAEIDHLSAKSAVAGAHSVNFFPSSNANAAVKAAKVEDVVVDPNSTITAHV